MRGAHAHIEMVDTDDIYKHASRPADETVGPVIAVLAELRHLDRLLDRAVQAAREIYGPAAASDPYRGLYIGDDHVQALLARQPGAAPFQTDGGTGARVPSERAAPFQWLHSTFRLDSFDLDLVLIALAPEVDLRYERIYAYLQDDVTRRRPSVDLALNLLCASTAEKLTRRAHVAPEAPLLRHGVMQLVADPNALQPPLLAQYLKLDDQITRVLLGQPGLDPRLAAFCEMVRPQLGLDDLPVDEATRRALRSLVDDARASRHPLRLCFYGPHGGGKRKAAEALATELRTPLLAVDLRGLLGAPDAHRLLGLSGREALVHDAVLYLNAGGIFESDDRVMSLAQVLKILDHHAVVIVGSPRGVLRDGDGSVDMISVAFSRPPFALRRSIWQAQLASAGIGLAPQDLDELAGQYRLTPAQVTSAVAAARSASRWRHAAGSIGPLAPVEAVPTRRELFAAASAQSGHVLAALARRIEPVYGWEDIVLPADQDAQLREICSQVRHQHVVYDTWGFGRRLSRGRGVNVLFTGPPGTGKTMAAEVIAGDLQIDLYKIDLSQVVSKYIGETEKNLDRIFTAAEAANAILFFDEADALFGKRSEVRDSHDRYANIEISYLLQKMEEYEGVAILATNLRQHMDEAFVRRLQIVVEFPFPDEPHRRRIWDVLLPADVPLAGDVDLDTLAREVKLAGGNLRNIALAAAFYAAEDGGQIGMAHLLQAARREYQKLGRAWAEGASPGAPP